MANKKFTFEEFNKNFWIFYRNKQLEIIHKMENGHREELYDIGEDFSNMKRKRLREI